MRPTAREYVASLSSKQRRNMVGTDVRFYAIAVRTSRNKQFVCIDTDEFTCIVPSNSLLGKQLRGCISSLRGWQPALYAVLRPSGECYHLELDSQQPRFIAPGKYEASIAITECEAASDPDSEDIFAQPLAWGVGFAESDDEEAQAEKPTWGEQAEAFRKSEEYGSFTSDKYNASKGTRKPKKDA